MNQNLCLICCYSFQEKRNRIITDEARDSFRKFCTELNVPLEKSSEKTKVKTKTCSLDLPYGERITVCGDCLSLIVLYVQQRSIQSGKEDKLLELQKAVCAALKDLQVVLEEVQNQIDDLHSTVRTGDESSLDSFWRTTNKNNGNSPRAFRAKILKLNTGLLKTKTVQKDGLQIPINIKMEPRENEEEDVNDEDEGHFDDTSFCTPEDDQCFEETDFPTPKITDTVGKSGKSETRRNSERYATKLPKCEDVQSNSEEYLENVSDFDDRAVTSSDEDWSQKKSEKLKLKKPVKRKRASPSKTKSVQSAKRIKTGKATQWKDDLLGRILVQMNNDIHEDNSDDETREDSVSNSFQYIDGKLKFRGILVNILEKARILQCSKCRKKFFETKDATGEDIHQEILVRDHILSEHNEEVSAKISDQATPIDVVAYKTFHNNKVSLRLACPMKYTYMVNKRRKRVMYYVCDYNVDRRKCHATISHRDGVYYRSQKGWNPDGSHELHPPDAERTNRRIELANAIAMYVADPSRSVEDVCSEMQKQSNGQLLNSVEWLRMRMLYAKHHRKSEPKEVKPESYPCPHCDSVYKERRGFTRHLNHHRDNSSRANQSSKKKPPPPRKSATLVKKAKERNKSKDLKPPTEAPNPQPGPGSSDSPSIVFNDPSAASNFVNKCISAIMKEVGFSVPSNDSTQVRPVSSTGSVSSDNSRLESVSVPQQSQGQWQHPSSVQSGRHPGFHPHQNLSGNSNQQMPSWPWTAL